MALWCVVWACLHLVISLSHSAVAAADYKTTGQALKQPVQVRVSPATYPNGYDLRLDVIQVDGPNGNFFDTRAFNGEIPGPTLLFERGNRSKVNFVNALKNPSPENAFNTFTHVNHSNLHTHGLHIPHKKPGDDVFIKIAPESTYKYEYDIPSDHAPGTYWYHPHYHGSTAIQTGGGAHGMIVIEDNAATDGVPSWLTALTHANGRDLQLVVSVLSSALPGIEAASGGSVVTGTVAQFVLVNGQNKPKITMTAGLWYRWRVVLASIAEFGSFTVPGCEIGVLAKDGIYLLSAPRASQYFFLASGNRVDVIVRCPRSLAGSTTKLSTDSSQRQTNAGGGGGGGGPAADANTVSELANQVIATISVVANGGNDDGTLASLLFSPTMPKYLSDMRTATMHGSKTVTIDGGNGCTVNEQRWNGNNNMFTVYKGTYEEFTVEADEHPMHIHVNPVQVVDTIDDWYAAGDFFDVVLANGVFRTHIADHTGTAVVHCHWLSHEDQGCMSKFTIADCATDDIAAGILGTCSTSVLGGGAIALIVVGSLAALAMIGAAVWFKRDTCMGGRKKPGEELHNGDL